MVVVPTTVQTLPVTLIFPITVSGAGVTAVPMVSEPSFTCGGIVALVVIGAEIFPAGGVAVGAAHTRA